MRTLSAPKLLAALSASAHAHCIGRPTMRDHALAMPLPLPVAAPAPAPVRALAVVPVPMLVRSPAFERHQEPLMVQLGLACSESRRK